MKNRGFGFNLSTQPYTGPVGYKVNWENKFGGGALDITAETIIKGIPVRDTYIGKMEGERFADNGDFRNKIINYLERPSPDNGLTYIRSLTEPFADGKRISIARVIGYIETNDGNRYEHFYPSIYGQPKGSIYPVENGGGDGGFGVMQLTGWPKPTYLQIWHWKRNIDEGVRKIRGSLNTASAYPNKVRTKGCSEQSYTDSKTGKRKTPPPCRPMPETKKYPAATDFDADELRMDIYSLYNSWLHYWIWDKYKGWIPWESNIEAQQRGSAYADSAEAIEDNPPSDF